MNTTKRRIIVTMLSLALVISGLLVVVFGGTVKVSAYSEAYSLPTLTGDKKADFIAVAKSQLGYKEDTDGTAYGKWFTDYIDNGVNYTALDWCAMYLSWCAQKAGISKDVIPVTSMCTDSMSVFKSQNRWHEVEGYTPKVGDIVYFKYGSTKAADHIGVVYNVSSTHIDTYEGNKSSLNGAVGESSYKLSYQYIVGYASPNYSGNEPTVAPATATPSPTTAPTATAKPTTTPSPTVVPTATPTPKAIKYAQPSKVLRVGASGNDVKWLQYCLNKYGNYKLGTDGKFGAGTQSALKKAQKKLKISADGVVGTNVVNKLKSAIGVSSAYIVVDTASNSVVTYTKVTSLKATRYKYNQIKLTWKKINDAKAYVIHRYNSKTKKYDTYKTVKTNSFIDTGLTVNATYKYKVRAYKNINGYNVYGAFSSVVSQSAKPATVGGTKLVKYSSRAIKFSWTRQSDVTGYQIYRKDSKNSTFKLIKTITTNKTTYFVNTGLTKNRTYYYKVRSYKTVNGKKVYGSFSTVRSIKIK